MKYYYRKLCSAALVTSQKNTLGEKKALEREPKRLLHWLGVTSRIHRYVKGIYVLQKIAMENSVRRLFSRMKTKNWLENKIWSETSGEMTFTFIECYFQDTQTCEKTIHIFKRKNIAWKISGSSVRSLLCQLEKKISNGSAASSVSVEVFDLEQRNTFLFCT